jgi:hypothetical protein
MAVPLLTHKPDRKPFWRVAVKVDGISHDRRFKTEAEARAFLDSFPHRGAKRQYATDGERITRNVTADDNGCWNWNLYVSPSTGYGFLTTGGRRHLAHRVSYESLVGPIPDGLQIDHLCRNRRCVNPEHLEPVTGSENCNRAPVHVAHNRAKTHCPNGHPYDEANTGRTGRYQHRYCRACARAANRRASAKRAAAKESAK